MDGLDKNWMVDLSKVTNPSTNQPSESATKYKEGTVKDVVMLLHSELLMHRDAGQLAGAGL